jgi:hypothetical protein
MTDAVTISLIAAIGGFCTSAFTAIISFFIHRRMVTLEQNTNSIKDELVAVTEKESFAKGLKKGREEPRG